MARAFAKFLIGLVALAGASASGQSPADSAYRIHAALTGAAEVPGPGDPDGIGAAEITVNSSQKRICFTLQASNIGPPTMAHIHLGQAGAAGVAAVTLSPPVNGTSTGCSDVARSLALAMLKNPAAYYVNVHTDEFPSGAIRGQLSK